MSLIKNLLKYVYFQKGLIEFSLGRKLLVFNKRPTIRKDTKISFPYSLTLLKPINLIISFTEFSQKLERSLTAELGKMFHLDGVQNRLTKSFNFFLPKKGPFPLSERRTVPTIPENNSSYSGIAGAPARSYICIN